MKLIKTVLAIVAGLLLSLSLNCFGVSAQEKEDQVGFSVNPRLESHQRDLGNSYFDVKVNPGEVLNLGIDVQNTSGQSHRFTINFRNAYTNDAGQIEYVDSKVKNDESLQIDVSEIATYEKEITLKAGELRTVPIQINVPKENIKGMVLGGIQVLRETDDEEQVGAQLVNRFAYVVGFRMIQSEEEIPRDLKLKSVKPGLFHHRTAVLANLQNPAATAMGNLTVKAKVKRAGSNKSVKTSTTTGLEMAPNSNFNYVIDWENEALTAGNYLLELEVKDKKGNEWKFEEEFEITAKAARQYNRSAVELKSKGLPIWGYAMIGILFAGVAALLFLLRRRKRDSPRKKTSKEMQGDYK